MIFLHHLWLCCYCFSLTYICALLSDGFLWIYCKLFSLDNLYYIGPYLLGHSSQSKVFYLKFSSLSNFCRFVLVAHSVQRGINLPLVLTSPSKDSPPSPPLKMKIFWPPPNFCRFPDFVLEESVWHAINLWSHWKACSFTRDQNQSIIQV